MVPPRNSSPLVGWEVDFARFKPKHITVLIFFSLVFFFFFFWWGEAGWGNQRELLLKSSGNARPSVIIL